MNIAYFDCQFGAAGDMLLGALLGAGLDETQWRRNLNQLALPEESFELSISDTTRASIASKKVDVIIRQQHEERHLHEIKTIIDQSGIARQAKDLSLAIFENLAQAEARVHGVPIEQVHFHEVGAVDAIVDIVGFAIGYHLLGIEKAFVSAVAIGRGVIDMAHGTYPVPGPAVLNLLSAAGAPIRDSQIDFECLTPTGAAILCTIAESWGNAPAFDRILATGYGAGTKNPPSCPNICRVILGQQNAVVPARFRQEDICVVEANLDDFSPQSLAFAVDKLYESGALDVTVTPATMKKGRSGHVLSALCLPGDEHKIEETILIETSSIGVRSYRARRLTADREWVEVVLSNHEKVRVKIAKDLRGTLINIQPEFDDCAEYAKRNKMALKNVIGEAASLARNLMVNH